METSLIKGLVPCLFGTTTGSSEKVFEDFTEEKAHFHRGMTMYKIVSEDAACIDITFHHVHYSVASCYDCGGAVGSVHECVDVGPSQWSPT